MKYLCIGTCSQPKKNRFTGQSVMFDGMVSYLQKDGSNVDIVDISPKIHGKGVIIRSLDYVIILTELLLKLLRSHYNIAYIITSQSRNGFLRDYAMISLCRWFKIPVITHQYGANYHQLLDVLDKKGLKRLTNMLGYVSSIIVEGDYMKEQFSFLPNYIEEVKVIPNGLPVVGKQAQKPKFYDGKQPFILFYLSNLIWSKGYFDVLKAVNILVNDYKLDVRCVFAGRFMSSADDIRVGIASKDDFDNYVREQNLTDKVIYYPGLYGEDKDELFYKANVFILPTYYINEGQPVSIVEAMAYGCVPLVTKYRHIPMMVNETNGCYVESQNPESIAEKIKNLILNTDEYNARSKQCISDYQQKFRFEVYASKVIECINAVKS